MLDIVAGVGGAAAKGYKGRVGDHYLTRMLTECARPPLLHVFGHVHAVQARCARSHPPLPALAHRLTRDPPISSPTKLTSRRA